jgi:oxygen-independent coproporphyrinogen III oxidase
MGRAPGSTRLDVLHSFPDMNLGIYIQVPFCRTKCTYCNFHTGVFSSGMYAPYVNGLVREVLEREALYHAAGIVSKSSGCAAAVNVDTVYIGGGTPSLLAPSDMSRVLDSLRSSFPCSLQEVTLEADPETITAEKVQAWVAAGINRISMGTQSFDDKELSAAGRLHRRADIYSANQTLRANGIRNISFDLIAGLPHQTEESWKRTVGELIALSPEHLSIYMLEIDEGSRLGREVLNGGARYSAATIPEDDSIADFYEYACAELAGAGYEHYEISNWAKPGLRSKHNLKYWLREPYFGIGAGAHSFDGAMRWANAHDPAGYSAALSAGKLPVEQKEVLSDEQSLDEELFLGLRLLDGINVGALEARYNRAALNSLRRRIDSLVERGLVEWRADRLRLAPSRISVSNEVFVELMA